jgi:PAS domain S-box-containing protein
VTRSAITMLYAAQSSMAADALRVGLGELAPRMQITQVGSIAEARRHLVTAAHYNAALIDLELRDGSGLELMSFVRERRIPLAIVAIIEPLDEHSAISVLTHGADEYIERPYTCSSRLPLAIERAVLRRAGETRLRSIIETQPSCVLRVDRDGTLLAVNAAGRAMFDHEQQVVGGSLYSFIAPADRERCRLFIERVCYGETGSIELQLPTPTGDNRIVEIRAVPLGDDASGQRSALGALRDVSERLQLEATVVKLEAERQRVSEYAAPNASISAALAAVEEQRFEQQLRAELKALEDGVEDTRPISAIVRLATDAVRELDTVVADLRGRIGSIVHGIDERAAPRTDAEAAWVLVQRAAILTERIAALQLQLANTAASND